MRRLILLLGFCSATQLLIGQSAPSLAHETTADPMAVGKAALQREDFQAAKIFFSQYLQTDPDYLPARFLLGNSELGLRDFVGAEKTYREVLTRDPSMWGAHTNLVLLYAESEQWSKFDEERARVFEKKQGHTVGQADGIATAIDVFTIGGQRYIVREYDPARRRFHTKYNFAWFAADGTPAGWIACESDDIDQVSFAKKHPAEAAAGKRSYSLDQYSPVMKTAGGQLTQTHATLKFYDDGEPTYEQVRADVVKVLEHRASAMSSTQTVLPAKSATADPSTAH